MKYPRATGTPIALAALAMVAALAAVPAPTMAGNALDFSNLPLIAAEPGLGFNTAPNADSPGTSEPAIALAGDGAMVIDGLAWLPWQVNMWRGQFGSAPKFFGAMDTDLRNSGVARTSFGGNDADVALTSNGTVLLADMEAIVNPEFNNGQLGVEVTRCVASATSPADCTHAYLDTSGPDRPWITTAGHTAWVSYHDAGSDLIRVQRSTDDGLTWTVVGSPFTGQGTTTGSTSRWNIAGPIVADPDGSVLYSIYAGVLFSRTKATGGFFVSNSTDGGRHWTSVRIDPTLPFAYYGPDTVEPALFPSLSVDPVTHAVYAVWSDSHQVWVRTSTDRGETWSSATPVAAAPTVLMPWVAARDGKVDVVYYGSDASFNNPDAVWNVFDSQLSGGSWTIRKVSNTPNRVGSVCLSGSHCNDDRQLLDLFEVAQDPITGKAAVIYTDTTIDTFSANGSSHQLPEIVLAFEQ
jgi:hypothetical protein